MSENVWMKLISLFLGMTLVFIVFGSKIICENHLKNYKIALLLPIDYGLRSVNLGQDPFFHSNIPAKVTLTIFIMFLLTSSYENVSENIKISPISHNNGFSFLSLFLILTIYHADYASSGVFVLTGTSTIQFAHYYSTVILSFIAIISISIHSKLKQKETFFIVSLFLGISSYMYPWNGIYIVFWWLGLLFLNVILIQVILSILSDGKVNRLWIILSYSTMIGVMFQGLLTESYLIIPLTSIALGITSTLSNKLLVEVISPFTLIKKYLNLLIIIILFSTSIFIPQQYLKLTLHGNSNLSVMSFNIHFGIGNDGLDNTNKIIELVAKHRLSIIAFQEVTMASITNGYNDIYSVLKLGLEQNGYIYSYFSQGGKYQIRNVIFSQFEIIETSTYQINPRVIYERNLIKVVINVYGTIFSVFATHLTHVGEKESNPKRVVQAELVTLIIESSPVLTNTVLIGDFNAEPNWPEIEVITSFMNDAWNELNPDEDGFSWPSTNPRQSIDYIFSSRDIVWGVG